MKISNNALYVLLLCFFLGGCTQEENKSVSELVRPIKTMVLAPANSVKNARTFPGKVQASRKVDLAFRISGPLIAFPVKEGEKVEKDALLARIDPRDYQTELAHVESALAEARANFESMKAGARPEDIKVLEAEVAAAKARYKEAEQHFKRYEKLYNKDVATKADYDRYESARDIAKAQLNTTLQNLKKGKKGARKEDIHAMQSHIRGLEAQEKKARAALDDTWLRAPFSGSIAKKFVENFQDVNAKTPIVSLHDMSKVELIVDVPEMEMAVHRREDVVKIIVTFDFLPAKKFMAEIKEFGTEADPKTKTFPVTLTMPAPVDIVLLPGMTANITAHMQDAGIAPAVFMIPAQAAFADELGGQHAWVVDQNSMTVSKRKIRVGNLSGEHIQIQEGL